MRAPAGLGAKRRYPMDPGDKPRDDTAWLFPVEEMLDKRPVTLNEPWY